MERTAHMHILGTNIDIPSPTHTPPPEEGKGVGKEGIS